ncbi:alpha/beta fold hydrolase [Eudoraea chungangensis]|uniref:alpha/beta fold hydrolase n=1 Tax=Eudoraea chungangensis TaxID=1481905 RepID=UPI0023EE0279|nr:alpha/beta hydrolase [Eudoraea chungangensis]
MSKQSLFKTETAKVEILNLYDQKLKELAIKFQYIEVNTRFGQTTVIRTGDKQKPPIILVHGSNGCAPIALETYPNLSALFCVYAIDVLAQPNKSAETRLDMKDDSYGEWMDEIIGQLKIEKVTMAGFSFGGLVILKTLEYNDSKIKEVFLTSPAYIVNGNPIMALFKVFIPIKRYMATKKLKYVEKFLSELFSERDEFAIKYLSKVFLEFRMDFRPVPVITRNKAKTINTPITIFASQNDLMFPGKKLLNRASKIFPTLLNSKLLKNTKHVPSKEQNKLIENWIMDWAEF